MPSVRGGKLDKEFYSKNSAVGIMAKKTQQNFSRELKDSRSIEVQIEPVKHLRVKQFMNQVLSEDLSDSSLGSAFGEGQSGA